MFACPATDDFFRARIDQMIDLPRCQNSWNLYRC